MMNRMRRDTGIRRRAERRTINRAQGVAAACVALLVATAPAMRGQAVPSAWPVDPNPSLSMQLNHASLDSIVITLKFANNNVTWGCEGIQAGVEYKGSILNPNFGPGPGQIPIHDVRFAQYGWIDYSNPFLQNNGLDPDVMLYGEGPLSGNISIGANQQFNLCKMNWDVEPFTPPQAVSFAYHANTGSAGVTGYLWINDPDLRAFGSATGLTGVYFPVELRSFRARLEGGMVVLQWETSSESNNLGFEVERRSGRSRGEVGSWERIDFVRGRGTTQEPASYMTIDMAEHAEGLYQYRLRQMDYDGTGRYSEEVEVEVGPEAVELRLAGSAPNPVRSGSEARIVYRVPSGLEGAELDLRLYDMLGRERVVILRGRAERGERSAFVPTSGLPAGRYLYRLRVGSQTRSGRLTILQ